MKAHITELASLVPMCSAVASNKLDKFTVLRLAKQYIKSLAGKFIFFGSTKCQGYVLNFFWIALTFRTLFCLVLVVILKVGTHLRRRVEFGLELPKMFSLFCDFLQRMV